MSIARWHRGWVLSATEVVDNVITALTSNSMIAPSYWVDPANGNNYFMTVQFKEDQVRSLTDLEQIPIRSKTGVQVTTLGAVANLRHINTPTEVDHYQLRRTFDIYVAPKSEDLSRVASAANKIIDDTEKPEGVRITMRGAVDSMHRSFTSFTLGLVLAIALVYLILMAQFASFLDPFIILLAIPPGISGVIAFLFITRTTMNVMSLMGVLMMTGIVVSNSISWSNLRERCGVRECR